MIRNLIIAISLAVLSSLPACAQGCGPANPNCVVQTAPAGTSDNRAASTAFVGGSLGGAFISGTPSAGNVPIATSGTAAAWGVLSSLGGVTFSGTPAVGNIPIATSGATAAWGPPNTANPFTIGTSLYPSFGPFRYNATSALLANTVGAKVGLFGLPAIDSSVTWVNTYLLGADALGNVTVYGTSPNGVWGSLFAARSSDNPSGTPQNVVGDNALGVHDSTGTAHNVWGRYTSVAVTGASTPSHVIGHEISIFNNGAAVAEDPFNFNPTGSSVGLRTDCAIAGAIGANSCGAGIDIVPNSAKFTSGINCANGSLDTGVTANPDCLSLPPTYAITWYNAAAAKTWQLFAGTGANGSLNLTTGGTGVLNVTGGGTFSGVLTGGIVQETTGAAWGTYSASVACGTATITTTSSRFRRLGKTTFVEADFTITALGTCNGTTVSFTFNLPNTPQSSGALAGREIVASGKGFMCTVLASTVSSICQKADATVLGATERYVISGVYENQ